MVCCVIGLGSMGKRRIGLLQSLGEYEIIGVDSNKDRIDEAIAKYGIKAYPSLDEANKYHNVDCAFICTSPISHSKIILQCLQHGFNVFSEITLIADDYEEMISLAKEKGLVLFLSSTFLYRPETCHIIDEVKKGNKPFNYIYHIGQYLPDWHPWEKYNNFFVGNKRTNGSREILAIELPWLVTCFGDIKNIQVIRSKHSSLEVDYNDNYHILLEHVNGNTGSLNVDVISRKAVRNMEVFNEDAYLRWGGTPDSLFAYNIQNAKEEKVNIAESGHKEGYASFVTENPYLEEIKSFFEVVKNNNIKPKWDFEKDLKLLKHIDKIEGI